MRVSLRISTRRGSLMLLAEVRRWSARLAWSLHDAIGVSLRTHEVVLP